MALREVFYIDIKTMTVRSKKVAFTWFPGFSIAQKQRSINSLHEALSPAKALEISTKSPESLGFKLSAFNLKNSSGIPLECIFQASKVYQFGGPYTELLYVDPKKAKQDQRHHSSGKLKCFMYEGIEWPLTPQTAFYDFHYIQLVRNSFPIEELMVLTEYQYFTDIEFNHTRSINCQARTVALISLMIQEFHEIPEMSQKEWLAFHRATVKM